MRSHLAVFVLACVTRSISSPLEARASGSLDSFIAAERPVALQGILDNIGASGEKVEGAAAGLVIASPSKSNPNCKARGFSVKASRDGYKVAIGCSASKR